MGIVNVLTDIDLPIARQCESNLQTIVDLSTKYLAPNADTSPNLEHQTKATRVLKSDRALRIFNATTLGNSTRLATNIQIETIQLWTRGIGAFLGPRKIPQNRVERCLNTPE